MKFIITIYLILFSTLYANENKTHDKNVISTLSPSIRVLLTKEMFAIEEGMKSVIPAYRSGDYKAIEKVGNDIVKGFILKQKLSKNQKEELRRKLPLSFIKLDKNFHSLAGKLKKAAKKKDNELIGFYFMNMTNSCIRCHSKYATEKFPKLAQ